MTRILLTALFVVAGCAPTMYAHRTKTAEDFRVEKAQCSAFAFQGYGSQSNPFIAAGVMRDCLEGKGWYPVKGPDEPMVQQASQSKER